MHTIYDLIDDFTTYATLTYITVAEGFSYNSEEHRTEKSNTEKVARNGATRYATRNGIP